MASLNVEQTLTANTEDENVENLLAEADYIMSNPDEFVTESVEDDVAVGV